MGTGSDVILGRQQSRPLRRRLAASVAALSLLGVTACSDDPPDDRAAAPDRGTGTVTATPDMVGSTPAEATASAALEPQEPVDVPAAIGQFEPPGAEAGLPPAEPAHCPGASPDHLLEVFPHATPFQAASSAPEPPDAIEGEVFTQCRMSYEVGLLDDECTIMEVRDVTFSPESHEVRDTHEGSITTTSVLTYFTGQVRKPGIVLDYTLSVGCDATSDLSDLEEEFRSIWTGHRDQFLATPDYR